MTLEELNQNKEITLKGELWKEIKDFENYAVSNYGRVFNLRKKDFKKFSVNSFFNYGKRTVKSRKYLAVNLYHKGKTCHRVVHKLVAEAFILNDDPEHKIYVDHIDNDPKNNMAVNLRWVSPRVNTEFARTDELQKYNRWLLEKIKDY